MSIKTFLGKQFAKHIAKKTKKWMQHPKETQEKVFEQLIQSAKHTSFGKDHRFDTIKTYDNFKKQVPIRDYEGLRPYIDRVVAGEKDVLWKDKPLYLAKTSGTTSGVKYIPISKESMPYHIQAARNALLLYIAETGNTAMINGKMIFLQGSPELHETGGIKTGRLSGIVAHYVPKYLTKNRLPSMETNCIEDWEEKVAAVVKETIHENMTIISGIPPWVQMYFEKLESESGKKIKELFPNFSLFVTGGVNFEPYRKRFDELLGGPVDILEVYPASEGFIAYQDSQKEEGLLLLLDGGIFYEFIPANEFYDENPTRLSVSEVELGVNYVIILNTNAGLWGYNIGDTVQFVSKDPYRIIVSGRIKHFTSAFGEHVIAHEVEQALKAASEGEAIQVNEFTVAPQVNPEEGLPYHEWFIEFSEKPKDIRAFASKIEQSLQEQNVYYKDLIEGNILRPLVLRIVKPEGFNNYMKSIGKLGGQNKVPRLSNDRKIADPLSNHIEDQSQ